MSYNICEKYAEKLSTSSKLDYMPGKCGIHMLYEYIKKIKRSINRKIGYTKLGINTPLIASHKA